MQAALRLLTRLFGIDPRSLALFRILAALVLLYDLAQRLPDLNVFYASGGIAPVELIRDHPLWHWSLHYLDGSPAFQAALFGLTFVFALALLVGYRTRLATICAWVLMASLHTRMPLVGNGGDLMLRLLLFWGMFVPLSRCWSVDAALRRMRLSGARAAEDDERLRRPVVSIGTTAMLVQMCSMYFFSGLYKFNADWLGSDWLGGDALLWTMAFDYFTLPPAHFLAGFPALLEWMALATVWLELAGPLLVFFPWQTGKIRLALIAAFAALHLTIHLTLTVGLFSIMSMAGWMLFVPPGFWNALRVPVFRRRASSVVSPATSDAKALQVATSRSMSSALWWSKLLAFIAVQSVCGVLLIYTLFQNATPLALEAIAAAPEQRGRFRWLVVPAPLHNFGQALTLNQTWDMFRYSPRFDGWYVARAELANGDVIDLFWERPASEEKPALPSAAFPNDHWRYYFHYLTDNEYAEFRQPATEFLCRRWNATHDAEQQIVRLQLLWYGEIAAEDGPNHDPDGDYVQRSFAVVETDAASARDPLEAVLRGLEPEPWD
jgi:hypothetical protein